MAMSAVRAVLLAVLTLAGTTSLAGDVEEQYGKSCAVCHAAGAAGAPKTGVPSEWESRMDKGMETLVKSVKDGLNAMPPKGMCFDCSDEDYQALIEFMAKSP
jgi:cytochrome c5